MVAAEINRLKREQCERTKHDSSFSHWKILIGPSDWEDHSKGKEGCTRYRILNLQENFGPGVYELGVAVLRSGLGREIYKLPIDSRRVVVVYIGKTDNLKARLQCYGRNGAHLANGCSDGSSFPPMGRSLFQEIFSQGFPIVFRWAPMQSKEAAERAEAQLLTTFDYAWNTSSNGTRRPDDILQMLNKVASSTRKFSDVAKWLLSFTQKQVGIPIKASKLPLKDDKSDEANNSSYNFLSRVFKLNRSRPRIVEITTGGIIQENVKICGVMLGDGSICRRPPAEKRVRCPNHKGMRRNVSTVKTIRPPKSESENPVSSSYRYQNVCHDVEDPPETVVESPVDEIITNTYICGIILDDGSICRRPPVEKRVRSPEHKGMRINVTKAKAIRELKSESESTIGNAYSYQNVNHDIEDPSKIVVENPVVDEIINHTNICGIILDDGSTCRRQPVKGRKRCLEHKGKRIHASTRVNQK